MLTAVFRRVRLEAMITLTCGHSARISGRAASPSMMGISMSRTTTSAGWRRKDAKAISPFEADATTQRSGSASICRHIRPRTTAESSTTMTLIRSPRLAVAWRVAGAFIGLMVIGALPYRVYLWKFTLNIDEI